MTRPDDQTFHDAIEGYCGRLSYRAGETVELHVSTHAESFDVHVERWGARRELVHTHLSIGGDFTAPPPDADAEGCGWPISASIRVGDDWRSGFYLVTMTAHGVSDDRSIAHAGFVVRGSNTADGRPRLLYVLSTNTWNAYNTWGGKSLYTGGTSVSFARPFARGMLQRPEIDRDDRKARPTRFGETPDADGEIFQRYRTDNAYPSAIGSTGWFTHGRRFVEWAESMGYHFDYAISSDLEDPDALDGYDSVVLVGHDEYWSSAQRDTLERHVAGGGRLASFSGNTMFWQVRSEAGKHGEKMTCYKYRAHTEDPILATGDSAHMTGMWADPLVARPEWTLLGAGSAFGLYHRFGMAAARGVGGFVVYEDDHWLMAETDLRYGDVLGGDDGVVGYETLGCPLTFNDLHEPVPSPYAISAGVHPSTRIVAWVPASSLGVGEYPKSIAALSDQGDLEFVADRVFSDDGNLSRSRARRGNAVMVTGRPLGPQGGEVITIGTTDWVFGLRTDRAVQQVTMNVLDRLGTDRSDE